VVDYIPQGRGLDEENIAHGARFTAPYTGQPRRPP
jgi:hypothetical protein